MRKFTIALAAALAIAAGSLSTGALARGGGHGGGGHGGGGHFGGGHFGGGHFGGGHFGGGGHFAFRGGHVGGGGFAFRGGHFHRGFGGGIFIGAPYALYGYDYGYDGCYRRSLVPTPYGLRWRRVWVCG